MPCWEILCSSLCIYRMVEQSSRCGTSRAPSPTIVSYVPSAAKSLSLFAGFTLFNGIGKSGAEIFSPTPLYCFFYFCVLFYFSVPLEHNSGQLCSFLTPHLPHSSLTPPLLLPFPLQALRTLQVPH